MPYNEPHPIHQESGSGIYWLLAVLAAVVVGVVSYLLFFQVEPTKKRTSVAYEEPLKPSEPVVEYTRPEPPMSEPGTETAAMPTEPESVVTEQVKPMPVPLTYIAYTVKKDDWLTSISKKRYGTRFYWPLIFQKNINLLKDQDALQPGMKLMIPDQVDITDDETMNQLNEAFIAAYNNYKRRGKVQKARWLLYACQTQVNPAILQTHKKMIDPADLKVIKGYLKRFPNPESER